MMKMRNILLVGLAATSLAACTRVQPGHVGIKVENMGSSAGVQSQPLGVGWYMTMFGTSIYEYPIFTNTYTWTKDTNEQNTTNQEMIFADKNGLSLTADVSVAYHVDSEKAPVLFQKYRMDMDGIVAGPMRNAIRAAIGQQASQMGVEEIYGPKKAELIARAQEQVRSYFEPFGLNVEQLYWASNIRLPPQVMTQINAKIANEQQALAAQANVATVTANANAREAEAKGEADAINIEGQAIRENPEILKLRAIEKWNGSLPHVMGSAAPMPMIGDQ